MLDPTVAGGIYLVAFVAFVFALYTGETRTGRLTALGLACVAFVPMWNAFAAG